MVHVDWLASDDVTSSAVFTLREAQFAELSWLTTASCVYVNSSDGVLVAQLSRVSVGGTFMSIVPALAMSSSNYTFVAYRPQYNDDRHVLQHYVHVVVETASVHNVLMDGRLLNVTTDWAAVCRTDGRLVSAVLRVNAGTHRLYTADGRPLAGLVYGFSNRSAYGAALASVNVGSGLWTDDYLWRDPVQTTTSLTSAHMSTVTSEQTTLVTMETSSVHVTNAVASTGDETMTSSLMSSDTVRSTSVANAIDYVSASESGTSGMTESVNHSSVKTDNVSGLTERRAPTVSSTVHVGLASSSTSASLSVTTSNYSTSVTSTDRRLTEITLIYVQRGRADNDSAVAVTRNVTASTDKQSSVSSTDVTTTVSTLIISTSSSSSNSQVQRDSTAATTSSTLTYNDNDDASLFELFKTACIYGGLPLICSLIIVWFLCTQTTLLKRAKHQRVIAAANDGTISLSRDQVPVSDSLSSDDCSLVLSESISGSGSSLSQSPDNHWATRIAPLTPAYFTMPLRLSLDESCLLQATSKHKAPVTRTVNVDFVRQLDDRRRDGDVQCDEFTYSNTMVNAADSDRLHIETPCHHCSQQKLHHLISLPQSSSMTVANRNICENTE